MPARSTELKAVWREARVVELRREGSLYWRLRLTATDLPPGRPGQFSLLSVLPGARAGQDPFLLRPLSILDANDANEQSFLFKVLGRGTAALARVGAGETLKLLGPLGKPFAVEASPHPFLIGGGVGIPPLHWLSRHLSAQGIAHRVVFGFNSAAEIPERLLSELDSSVPLTLCTLDGSAGVAGNPVDYLREEQGHAEMRVQACGPLPMLEALKGAVRPGDLLELSLEERMACGVGVCRGCVVPVNTPGGNWAYETVCREGPVFDADRLASAADCGEGCHD